MHAVLIVVLALACGHIWPATRLHLTEAGYLDRDWSQRVEELEHSWPLVYKWSSKLLTEVRVPLSRPAVTVCSALTTSRKVTAVVQALMPYGLDVVTATTASGVLVLMVVTTVWSYLQLIFHTVQTLARYVRNIYHQINVRTSPWARSKS